ncbi:hypothetical protein NL676_016552 [Syzygium grande]|nr:hypothetical protein NL676_016552 [Syzygium grande]
MSGRNRVGRWWWGPTGFDCPGDSRAPPVLWDVPPAHPATVAGLPSEPNRRLQSSASTFPIERSGSGR